MAGGQEGEQLVGGAGAAADVRRPVETLPAAFQAQQLASVQPCPVITRTAAGGWPIGGTRILGTAQFEPDVRSDGTTRETPNRRGPR